MKLTGISLIFISLLFPLNVLAQCIKGNCENGEGTYVAPDGAIYVGHWKEGNYHGQGSIFLPDGEKIIGKFEHGELIAPAEKPEKKTVQTQEPLKATQKIVPRPAEPTAPALSAPEPLPQEKSAPLKTLEGTSNKAKKNKKAEKTQQAKQIKEPAKTEPPQQTDIPGKYPEASARLLTVTDIEDKGLWALKIMRNEIFARRGHFFKSPLMIIYFDKQGWYTPKAIVNYMELSDIEKKNIKLIRKFEGK